LVLALGGDERNSFGFGTKGRDSTNYSSLALLGRDEEEKGWEKDDEQLHGADKASSFSDLDF